jgi:hypothetical protein
LQFPAAPVGRCLVFPAIRSQARFLLDYQLTNAQNNNKLRLTLRITRHAVQTRGSGNPAGAPVGSRHRQQLNGEFIAALLRDFRQGGPKAIERVRRMQPASYLKILALLVPREHKIEQGNPLGALSDEQLALMVAELEERIARRVADSDAKLIEGTVEPAVEATTPLALEPPKRRPNRLMMEADTAIGPRERKPRKRKAKPPGKRDAE